MCQCGAIARRPNFFCAVAVFTGARLRLQEDGDRVHILQNLREAVQAQLSRAVGSSVRALLPTSNGDEERETAIACSPRDKHGDAEHRCLARSRHMADTARHDRTVDLDPSRTSMSDWRCNGRWSNALR
jgi:hypothetical protein